MGNQEHQEQSTDLEPEILSEEPPSFEGTLDELDEMFDSNSKGIDAVELLSEAEIDFSEFLQRVQCQMEQYPNLQVLKDC